MTAATAATASGGATLPGSAARPFRFGMLCRHAGGDGAAWRERVWQAEDLGFDALLVSDHLDDQSAPIPALGAAAMVSSALRLGTLPFLAGDLIKVVLAVLILKPTVGPLRARL